MIYLLSTLLFAQEPSSEAPSETPEESDPDTLPPPDQGEQNTGTSKPEPSEATEAPPESPAENPQEEQPATGRAGGLGAPVHYI